MTAERKYADPASFRRALTDRLRSLAAASRWTLPQLQRQMAYDRLLERLYLVDDGWIVKGATALLARDLSVRATIDVDLYRQKARNEAEADLRAAADQDIGDWFRFDVGPSRSIGDDAAGVPDAVPPLARVSMPDVEQHGYRAYPLADHVADKVVATFQRYGKSSIPSTRYRDLVDLVAIATGATVDAAAQLTALASESGRRGVALPDRFTVPDRSLWESGYVAEARRSLLPTGRTLDEALAIAKPFLDPLLDGSASGEWDPQVCAWRPASSPGTRAGR